MRFAKRVFLFAGLWGIVFLTPMLFLERQVGEQDPPAITHPEFFYGFLACALAWQVLFLFLSRDPLRYRTLIIPCILEKVPFGLATIGLFALGRISGGPLFGGLVDLLLGALFAWSYVLLGRLPVSS